MTTTVTIYSHRALAAAYAARTGAQFVEPRAWSTADAARALSAQGPTVLADGADS